MRYSVGENGCDHTYLRGRGTSAWGKEAKEKVKERKEEKAKRVANAYKVIVIHTCKYEEKNYLKRQLKEYVDSEQSPHYFFC